jgi:carbon-monoxide dehydrogenase large subunit
VYSGADLASMWAAPMPCAWPVTPDMKNPPHYPIAVDKVTYVGDGVAAVLATSETASRDALDLIDVDYDVLPAVIDLEDALTDKVVIHDSIGTNKSYTWPLLVEATPGCVEDAFKKAAYTVSERYVQQRLIPMAMEPRAIAAIPQPFGGDITLYSATQVPHILKVMTALTLGIPEHQLRVVAPSVGGGFGSKLDVYAEELLCVGLARKHNAPVLGRGTQRERPGHHPRSWANPVRRARSGRKRQVDRRAHPPDRRHGRLSAARHSGRAAPRCVPLRGCL